MAQYKTGTITVTNGSTSVVGSGTAWAANVAVGNQLVVVGLNLVHDIAQVVDDTHLILSSPYVGEDAAGASYAIVRDFTNSFGLPLIQPGDVQTATLVNRALTRIDQLLATQAVPHVPLLVAEGGTGAQSFTARGLLLGNGAGALRVLAPLTAGALLVGGGASADPTALAAGTNGTIMQMVGGTPTWVAPTSATVGLGNVVNACSGPANNRDLTNASTVDQFGLGRWPPTGQRGGDYRGTPLDQPAVSTTPSSLRSGRGRTTAALLSAATWRSAI